MLENPEIIKKISQALTTVNEQRLLDNKCSLDVKLDIGTAKIYHMGKNSPVVRIDLKVKDN
jgi:hypothetical protein